VSVCLYVSVTVYDCVCVCLCLCLQIVGWDLYNTLDQPAMLLAGHRFPVYRIVTIGPNERCCSLDESGTLCWWDSSLTTPSDDHRLVTQVAADTDRLRDFDLYLNCGVNFSTQHGCVVVGAGRKQLTYRISDFSPNESPPLAILFSKTLLSLVTVHLSDVIFWSVVSAERHKTLNNIFGLESHTRACSACLDDRGRKLYVGDTDGSVGVYNCLNGLKLKSIFVMPHAAIRHLVYTTEKYLIAIAGTSDLLVVDEYHVPQPPDPMSTAGRRREQDDKEPVTSATEACLRQVCVLCCGCCTVLYYTTILCCI
jgi:WD40 repeat protein